MEELGRREQRLEFENRKREIMIKMLKKENRLLTNQTSKSELESDLKLEELAKICGLAEKNKKMEEEPARLFFVAIQV